MKELKKYNLLQVKEKLKRQKSINELSQIQADEAKCQTISRELDRLLSENHALIEEIVERKKTKVKRQVRETLLKKQDENLGVTKRGQ